MSKYFSRIKYLFSNHKKVIILSFVLIIIQGILGIISTLFSAFYGIDVALSSKEIDKILVFALVTFAFSFVTALLFHLNYQHPFEILF